MFKTRSQEKELMDLGYEFYNSEEYEECLRTLFKINQLLGFFKHTVNMLKVFPKTSSLIDMGCGGGLFLLHLNQFFPDMHMTGIDISKEAIECAQKELNLWEQKNINVSFQQLDDPLLILKPNSIDIMLLTLVCHHLENAELILFLKKAYQVTRSALIINDLHRHPIAYWFYKLLSPLLFRNRLITHDGLVSIQRAFTKKELVDLLEQANITQYQIKWHFPFRWSVFILKDNQYA